MTPTVFGSMIAPTRSKSPTVEIAAGVADAPDVFTPAVRDVLATTHRTYAHALGLLLRRRRERAGACRDGALPELPAETAGIRASEWRVQPAPADLADRRCEITGPADRKMVVSALNSGARVFLCDLEDALSPTWANVVAGLGNIRDVADRSISFTRPDGTVDRLAEQIATMVVRPRGLHLVEPRLSVDGRPVPAPLFDVVTAAVLAAPGLTGRGSGLYLYLPKLESRHEAEWWDAVLGDVERRVGLDPNSIRVTVLIETIHAAFEMDEILHALRDRITGLNAGRWDYIFSIVKSFGTRPDFVLPDRGRVTMTVPFMAAYAERLVAVCHRRGAHAIGGMSAFIPNRRRPDVAERALVAVRADKEREASLGYDGTWVAHPDLVSVATGVFDRVLGDAPNQLGVMPAPSADVSRLVDVSVPDAGVTKAGVENNVAVSLEYLAAWLDGRGAVAIDDLMEDLATAEISRCQLWQWVHHGVRLPDGTRVTDGLVADLVEERAAALREEGGDERFLGAAAEIVRTAIGGDEPPEFLSLLAMDQLG